MRRYPDNNPDNMSGFRVYRTDKMAIPTIIPTMCRDSDQAACIYHNALYGNILHINY